MRKTLNFFGKDIKSSFELLLKARQRRLGWNCLFSLNLKKMFPFYFCLKNQTFLLYFKMYFYNLDILVIVWNSCFVFSICGSRFDNITLNVNVKIIVNFWKVIVWSFPKSILSVIFNKTIFIENESWSFCQHNIYLLTFPLKFKIEKQFLIKDLLF